MFSESVICRGEKRFEISSLAQKDCMRAATSEGPTVPTLLVEYGGARLNRVLQQLWRDELARAGANLPWQSLGIWILGPALLAYRTEVQNKRLSPKNVRGGIRRCQGYSEPGVGSDLPSVRTKAKDTRDHWLLNDQRTRTSWADQADWIFAPVCMVRDAPGYKGISFLPIDAETAGVTTTPIRLISGKRPFSEIFFDSVSVSKMRGSGISSIIGDETFRWDIAKHVFLHKFGMFGSGSRRPLGGRSVGKAMSDQQGLADNPVWRVKAMNNDLDSMSVCLTLERRNMQVASPFMSSAVIAATALRGAANDRLVGQAAVAAGAGGLSAGAFHIDIGQLKQRKQAGVLIGTFQVLHRSVHLWSEIDMSAEAIANAGRMLDTHPDEAAAAVSLARCATDVAKQMVIEGVQRRTEAWRHWCER